MFLSCGVLYRVTFKCTYKCVMENEKRKFFATYQNLQILRPKMQLKSIYFFVYPAFRQIFFFIWSFEYVSAARLCETIQAVDCVLCCFRRDAIHKSTFLQLGNVSVFHLQHWIFKRVLSCWIASINTLWSVWANLCRFFSWKTEGFLKSISLG